MGKEGGRKTKVGKFEGKKEGRKEGRKADEKEGREGKGRKCRRANLGRGQAPSGPEEEERPP